MEDILRQIEEIREDISKYEKAYADECVKLYNQKGFDMYKPKWRRKTEKIAVKYADLLVPLKNKHNALREEINKKEAERINNQFKD